MHHLSLVLFIKEQPVGYTISVENNVCNFTPTEFSNAQVDAPVFSALIQDDKLLFRDLTDSELLNQIRDKFPMKEVIQEVSVAP